MMKRRLRLLSILLLLVCGTARADQINAPSAVAGGSVTPGSGFSAGANPTSIIPTVGGNIWYVDALGAGASDANSCLTSALPCLTIQGAVNKTSTSVNDVILIAPADYVETVTINASHKNLALIGTNAATPDLGDVPTAPDIIGTPAIDGHLTLGLYLYGLTFDATGAPTATIRTGTNAIVDHCFVWSENNVPAISVGKNTKIRNNWIYGGGGTNTGIVFSGASPDVIIENNIFSNINGVDISSTGNLNLRLVIRNNTSADINKASYISITNSGTASVTGHQFAIDTAPTAAQVGYVAGLVTVDGNWPNGDIGTNAGVQPKTVSSTIITTGGVTEFTASGSLYCSDILLETGSTGLATGTNFTVTSDNTRGLTLLCAEAVANLGATKTVKCGTASVTPLVPFTLVNGNTLKIACTGTQCPNTGIITLTPMCMRLTPYASMN